MVDSRQFGFCFLFVITSVSATFAQTSSPPSPPDYRPTVEIQHEDLASARSHFKSQILRRGPAPTEWEDLETPKGAAEIVYSSAKSFILLAI